MHGNIAAKYHIYPCATNKQMSPSEPLADPGDPLFDYLRTALLKDLSSQAGCLRMAVQFFQNEATTPVNDSTVVWDTPFQDVAQIDIPRQTFGTPGQVLPAAAAIFLKLFLGGILQLDELQPCGHHCRPPPRRQCSGS
jgi:hypothetical protein